MLVLMHAPHALQEHEFANAGQIDELLSHQWFAGIDFARLREGKGPHVPEICDTLEGRAAIGPLFLPLQSPLVRNGNGFL